jgi:hypothetical protein
MTRKELAVNDLVQVMVPREFLPDVYTLLAKLTTENNAEQPTEEELNGSLEEKPEDKKWTPDLIRRMYEESSPGMTRALNYMAEHPDRWIPAPEVTEAIEPGRDSRRLGGTLGAFGKRVKNRYGMGTWPFHFRWDSENGHALYWMDDAIAKQIQSYKNDAE